jgi:16S rRNA (uracil1498-N3)-methyltransferase
VLPRFLAASLDPHARVASLGADETHHLTHVVRIGVGEEIAVFDGRGREYRARVERVDRSGAQLSLLEELVPTREPAVRLTLAQALLKGEKMDAVVRDATMMGASAIVPIVTAHTAASPRVLHTGHAAERWRRVAIASAKQCRRAVVPVIGDGTPFAQWITEDASELRLVLFEPASDAEGHPVSAVQGVDRPASASILVGPEGGWSAAEQAAALDAGWMPITIGRRTLRADAVPIAAMGILLYLWGDL